MRCEVFVDRVVSIAVHTTTKSVYRDEFEMLQIFGTDAEGNTFSTLRGIEFGWGVNNEEDDNNGAPSSSSSKPVVPLTAKGSRNILQIVPFRGSQQEVDPVIAQMELQVIASSRLISFPNFVVTRDYKQTRY